MTQLTSRTTVARDRLLKEFQGRMEVNPSLSRAIVSYQSNRKRPFYRWFKYKEGFSAALVEYLLQYTCTKRGRLFDPFAGSGAALLVAREAGLDVAGNELLPVGCLAFQSRLAAASVDPREFSRCVKQIQNGRWRVEPDDSLRFGHLRITRDAFSKENELDLQRFRTSLRQLDASPSVQCLLKFAAMAVLESISYTRKDGQYLRWDSRAPRRLPGKSFDKGSILDFESAICQQLLMMSEDLRGWELFPVGPVGEGKSSGSVDLTQGSCLDLMPEIPNDSCDLLITSPPYCNRYDYTRTYALELAYLGVDEVQLKQLRQSLLSCTVENQSKVSQLRTAYALRGRGSDFETICQSIENQAALQEVLQILEDQREALNNSNIPRMVRNYFLESAIVIFEMARIVKPGGYSVIINDNVQYHGEEIPVDLILSSLAERAGFAVEAIWVLPRGKGNSSQQMGTHGRNELRKCAYVWRRK